MRKEYETINSNLGLTVTSTSTQPASWQLRQATIAMAAVGHAAELVDDNVNAFQIGYGRRMQLLQDLEAGGWHDNANTDEIINNTTPTRRGAARCKY